MTTPAVPRNPAIVNASQRPSLSPRIPQRAMMRPAVQPVTQQNYQRVMIPTLRPAVPQQNSAQSVPAGSLIRAAVLQPNHPPRPVSATIRTAVPQVSLSQRRVLQNIPPPNPAVPSTPLPQPLNPTPLLPKYLQAPSERVVNKFPWQLPKLPNAACSQPLRMPTPAPRLEFAAASQLPLLRPAINLRPQIFGALSQAAAAPAPLTSGPTTSSAGHPHSQNILNIINGGKVQKQQNPVVAKLKFALQQHLSQQAGPSTSSNFTAQTLPGVLPLPKSCITKKASEPPQVITSFPKRTSADDYFIPALNAFVNQALVEWRIISIEPKISMVLHAVRFKYFRLAKVNAYRISWNDIIFTDATNFTIDPDQRLIQLNRKTMLTCSRGNLLSVLFHALIHCAVYESSAARGRCINTHDSNFNEIMKHFNAKLDLQIGTDHTFLLAAGEDIEMYQCQGKCPKIGGGPFSGIIKCHTNQEAPPPIITTSNHQTHCGGAFHKVFEITRTVNNNTETHYVIHQKFNDPKTSSIADAHHISKINIKPREFVDMTEDDGDGAAPKVVAMNKVIDLEDEEFAENRKKTVRKVVEIFRQQQQTMFDTCPFCEVAFEPFGGFRPHLDLCLGFKLR